MKEQYVGDISDYRKYVLLRELADGGRNTIGVCWMLTPPDGRPDGQKLAYLNQPDRYRAYDPALFDLLRNAAAEPNQRRLRSIEASDAIPGALYFNDVLADNLDERRTYMRACRAALQSSDLVFFDPDNGLEVSLKMGRKWSSKYVYLKEVQAFYTAGKSVLIYQHFPRIERQAFIASCRDRLGLIAPGVAMWAFETKHVVFLLLVHPKHRPALAPAAERAATRWHPDFISGVQLVAPEGGGGAAQ